MFWSTWKAHNALRDKVEELHEVILRVSERNALWHEAVEALRTENANLHTDIAELRRAVMEAKGGAAAAVARVKRAVKPR